MKKKRILILAMSCNDQFFADQVEVIKNTWAKPIIEGKYENIDFMYYTGSLEKHSYDTKTKHLNLRCEDNIDNTFKKTYYAFSLLRSNEETFNYDYIFRTNTSTFVNVELLDAFVQSLTDDSILWCSELYSLSEGFVPRPLYLYGRGNGILFSKKLVDLVLKEGLPFLYLEKCDDWIIGNILNSYWIKQGESYLKHIKSYKHGWFRCIGTKAENGHSICPYYNDNTDFNFLKQFITIQIKRYREREIENKNYTDLWEIFSKNHDTDLKHTVQGNIEYSENPNVFIGSILGYMGYQKWLNFDKIKLYNIEINNKASDDAERYKEKRELL